MTSKLTRERIEWLNYAATGLAANGTEMAMSPQDVIALTERCLAAMDSEPIAWHAKDVRDDSVNLFSDIDSVNSALSENQYLEITPLYRHAHPALVVPEIDRQAIADKVYGKCCRIPGATFYNAAEFAIDEVEACRAAMLQAGNSPVIPDGYVMVPKVVTPEIGNAINEVGHRCTCGNCSQRLWDLLLAAAPQEVQGES